MAGSSRGFEFNCFPTQCNDYKCFDRKWLLLSLTAWVLNKWAFLFTEDSLYQLGAIQTIRDTFWPILEVSFHFMTLVPIWRNIFQFRKYSWKRKIIVQKKGQGSVSWRFGQPPPSLRASHIYFTPYLSQLSNLDCKWLSSTLAQSHFNVYSSVSC